MRDAAFNYVRMFRQRHAFSERELATLIAQRWHTSISRMEGGREPIGLRAALALQVLFRQEPHRMFPGLYEAVEDEVMRRAKDMIDELEGRSDSRSLHKRQFLEGLAADDNTDAV